MPGFISTGKIAQPQRKQAYGPILHPAFGSSLARHERDRSVLESADSLITTPDRISDFSYTPGSFVFIIVQP